MQPTETLTFLGTIAELKAVLKASEIKHSIKSEDDAYLKVDLSGPTMVSASVKFYDSRAMANERHAIDNRDNRHAYAVRREPAKGIIKAVANGSTVDLEVDLETDETMPMHKEVHERWQQFYAYLVSRGRLGQEPEATAAQTEIDGQPEPGIQPETGQHSDKRRVSRRQSNQEMRIKVGLVQWRNQKTGISIEDILAGGGGLPGKSTYYEYVKEGLGYTSEDIESFGTSFGDLWASHNQGKLEFAISAILDKLGRNSDETRH